MTEFDSFTILRTQLRAGVVGQDPVVQSLIVGLLADGASCRKVLRARLYAAHQTRRAAARP